MIAAEVRVNGQLIGSVYAHNTGSIDSGNIGDTGDLYLYKYEVATIPSWEGEFFTGEILHNRNRGWEKLIREILAKVNK